MRMTNKHIEFEVQIKGSPFGMFGGGTSSSSESTAGEGNYEELTEDGVNELARMLGGV